MKIYGRIEDSTETEIEVNFLNQSWNFWNFRKVNAFDQDHISVTVDVLHKIILTRCCIFVLFVIVFLVAVIIFLVSSLYWNFSVICILAKHDFLWQI